MTMMMEYVSHEPFDLEKYITVFKILNNFFRITCFEPVFHEIPSFYLFWRPCLLSAWSYSSGTTSLRRATMRARLVIREEGGGMKERRKAAKGPRRGNEERLRQLSVKTYFYVVEGFVFSEIDPPSKNKFITFYLGF
jgi:hypothetical protein